MASVNQMIKKQQKIINKTWKLWKCNKANIRQNIFMFVLKRRQKKTFWKHKKEKHILKSKIVKKNKELTNLWPILELHAMLAWQAWDQVSDLVDGLKQASIWPLKLFNCSQTIIHISILMWQCNHFESNTYIWYVFCLSKIMQSRFSQDFCSKMWAAKG